jgi:membrane protein YdbS with pleckstrin-like domain
LGAINPTALRIGFALLLVYCAARLMFQSGGRAHSAISVAASVVGFAIAHALARWLGWRLGKSHSRWGALYRRHQRVPIEHDYEI